MWPAELSQRDLPAPSRENAAFCFEDCPPSCLPRTCEGRCGIVPDGCGEIMHCGDRAVGCSPVGCGGPGRCGLTDNGCGTITQCPACGPSCGDDRCEAGESCSNCARDCNLKPRISVDFPSCPQGGGHSGCAGTPVSFFVVPGSTNDPAPLWSFSDGKTAHGVSLSHIFRRPGTYRISVWALDYVCGGARTSDELEVVIVPTDASNYDDALALIAERKWAEAEALLLALENPTAETNVMLAYCQARLAKAAQALDGASSAVDACLGGAALPCHEATYALGASLVHLQRYQNAITRMTQVIDHNPRSHWAYYWRGRAYGHTNRNDRMVADYETFLRLAGDTPEAHTIRQLLAALRGAGGTGPVVECGNGRCDPGEDETSCVADCRCGNGACNVKLCSWHEWVDGQLTCGIVSEPPAPNERCTECWVQVAEETPVSCPSDCPQSSAQSLVFPGSIPMTLPQVYLDLPYLPPPADDKADPVPSRTAAKVAVWFERLDLDVFVVATDSVDLDLPAAPPPGASVGTPSRTFKVSLWDSEGHWPEDSPTCFTYQDVAYPAGSGAARLFEFRESTKEWVDITVEWKEDTAACGAPTVEAGVLAIFTTHNRVPSVSIAGPGTCHPSPHVPCVVNVFAAGRDPDGDKLHYAWTGCAGSGGSARCIIADLTSETLVTATARDEKGGLARAKARLHGINRPPVFAWEEFDQAAPMPVGVTGRAEFGVCDPDGDEACHCTVGDVAGACTLVDTSCRNNVFTVEFPGTQSSPSGCAT